MFASVVRCLLITTKAGREGYGRSAVWCILYRRLLLHTTFRTREVPFWDEHPPPSNIILLDISRTIGRNISTKLNLVELAWEIKEIRHRTWSWSWTKDEAMVGLPELRP